MFKYLDKNKLIYFFTKSLISDNKNFERGLNKFQ